MATQTGKIKMVSKESQTEDIKGHSDVNVSPGQSIGETEYEEEYVFDEDYKGAIYQSQPCFNKRGISYTPPGWKRAIKRKSQDNSMAMSSKKSLFQ